jgi:hypothetical protein
VGTVAHLLQIQPYSPKAIHSVWSDVVSSINLTLPHFVYFQPHSYCYKLICKKRKSFGVEIHKFPDTCCSLTEEMSTKVAHDYIVVISSWSWKQKSSDMIGKCYIFTVPKNKSNCFLPCTKFLHDEPFWGNVITFNLSLDGITFIPKSIQRFSS